MTGGSSVGISILACSKGAEVYSFLWRLRSYRPDLHFVVQAVDISQEIIDFAKEGAYSIAASRRWLPLGPAAISDDEKLIRSTHKDQGVNERESIFQRMYPSEMDAMFDKGVNSVRIKSWLREGITWRVGDAGAPQLIDDLGPQDIVVANRFLCHMEPAAAERCLRNVARLVRPGGYLFVSGVDLDVRTKVAKDLGWNPIPDSVREIHEGDFSLEKGWPLQWWGLEPFSHDRPDWQIRYASVFQIGVAAVPASIGARGIQPVDIHHSQLNGNQKRAVIRTKEIV
jgi:SAM-dependent methyltransferase